METSNFNTKLHEACSKDPLATVNQCVHFIEGFAYATNGHLLIRQSMDYHFVLNKEELNGRSIHKDNFKAIMSFDVADACDEGVLCKDTDGRTALFDYYEFTQNEKVPDFDKLINQFQSQEINAIGITPKYMTIIDKALHNPSGKVRIRFGGQEKGMLIDVSGIPDQVALLMPAMIDGSLF